MKISTISTQNVDLGSTQTITGAKTAQNLTVTTNALNLSVGQIAFPASQNASADANTLDDYEEGTFTPVVSGTTTAGAATYTSQIGIYVKIGKTVFILTQLAWTAHTGTGNLTITGLPFTLSASPTLVTLNVYHESLALTASYYTNSFYAAGSGTSIAPVQFPVGGGAAAVIAMDTDVPYLLISGFYNI